MKVYLPIRTWSEKNLRQHWAKKAARTKKQRQAANEYVQIKLRTLDDLWLPEPPLAVILTRIAPRDLDDGNLGRALSAIQDGVADALGIDDRHIKWTYKQRRGKPREYAVEVEIETR